MGDIGGEEATFCHGTYSMMTNDPYRTEMNEISPSFDGYNLSHDIYPPPSSPYCTSPLIRPSDSQSDTFYYSTNPRRIFRPQSSNEPAPSFVQPTRNLMDTSLDGIPRSRNQVLIHSSAPDWVQASLPTSQFLGVGPPPYFDLDNYGLWGPSQSPCIDDTLLSSTSLLNLHCIPGGECNQRSFDRVPVPRASSTYDARPSMGEPTPWAQVPQYATPQYIELRESVTGFGFEGWALDHLNELSSAESPPPIPPPQSLRPVGTAAVVRASRQRRNDPDGDRPTFLCKIQGCGRDFTTRHNLRNHMNSHRGIKPYRCPTCRKKFTTNSTMIRHRHGVHKFSSTQGPSA